MRIDILKTPEISKDLWLQISEGFNECFDTQLKPDDMKHGLCTQTQTGYGYHAIAISDDGDLMGYTVFTPTFYVNDLKILVGGSTFIRKKYRDDFLLFAKIVKALEQRCVEDGFDAVVAVPNKNSIEYAIRINRFVYVADLDYYILPLSPSRLIHKPYLRFFDFALRASCRFWLCLNNALAYLTKLSAEERRFRLVVDERFYRARFHDACYLNVTQGEYSFYYRHYDENGVDTVYLMDFRQKGVRTYKALCKALRYIVCKEQADAILFVGFMGLKQMAMIKTPQRFAPKPLPFTYHVIDNKNVLLKEAMANKNAWDFSLMNFDVR